MVHLIPQVAGWCCNAVTAMLCCLCNSPKACAFSVLNSKVYCSLSVSKKAFAGCFLPVIFSGEQLPAYHARLGRPLINIITITTITTACHFCVQSWSNLRVNITTPRIPPIVRLVVCNVLTIVSGSELQVFTPVDTCFLYYFDYLQ